MNFKEVLTEENFGTEEHLEKIYSHFLFVQKMIVELRIMPEEYREKQKIIYKYFTKKKISASYSARIISLLNKWGKYYSRKQGKDGKFYDEVLVPRGRELSAIVTAQRTKRGTNTELGVRVESKPLTPQMLYNSKEKIKEEHYNWLYLSVWLGLRPSEVESLKDIINYKIEVTSELTTIEIYQAKLQNVSEDKRWKTIPLIFSEQLICIEIINNKIFKKPLNKTVQKNISRGVTLYGGRKNFVDLMLNREQKIEDISMWLGHRDISTTWQHYKNKKIVKFTETSETRKAKLSIVK